MSSLPFISHHLFVAAVERERGHKLRPRANQPDHESSSPQTNTVELPSGDIDLDRVVDNVSGSPLMTET
jgi:hypothetical protein